MPKRISINKIATSYRSGLATAPYMDLTRVTPKSAITADLYNYIRCTDAFGSFRLDTMIRDAFREGPTFDDEKFEQPAWVTRKFIEIVSFSETFGHANLHIPGEGVLDPCPPLFAKSCGGIVRFNDDEYGRPESWQFKPNEHTVEITVPMDETILFFAPRRSRDYRGSPVLEPVIHDMINLRRWRFASGYRAKEYARIGRVFWKKGTWTSEEKASVDNAFPSAAIATVGGDSFESHEIGGLLNDSELAITTKNLKESIAAGFAVAESDLIGASAGQKLSTDANASAYFMTLEDIQGHYTEHAEAMYAYLTESMGFPEFQGFKAPREVPLELRIQQLQDALTNYLTIATLSEEPEMKQIGHDLVINLARMIGIST